MTQLRAAGKRFNVVITKDDGGVEVYRMFPWMRQHPEEIPPGIDIQTANSHRLRDGLKNAGWRIQETADEVRLIRPSGNMSDHAIDEVLGESVEPQEEADDELSFALERQLRDFIAQNIKNIGMPDKILSLYIDPSGRDGVEYPTEVGPIDILAVDKNGGILVFELKRGRTPDHVVGQLTRYMGWLRHTIGKNRQVHGVIVAKEISDNLRYAISVVPNVSLFEYAIDFRLKPVQSHIA